MVSVGLSRQTEGGTRGIESDRQRGRERRHAPYALQKKRRPQSLFHRRVGEGGAWARVRDMQTHPLRSEAKRRERESERELKPRVLKTVLPPLCPGALCSYLSPSLLQGAAGLNQGLVLSRCGLPRHQRVHLDGQLCVLLRRGPGPRHSRDCSRRCSAAYLGIFREMETHYLNHIGEPTGLLPQPADSPERLPRAGTTRPTCS